MFFSPTVAITVTDDTAILIVGVAMVLAVGWGSYVSVRSAAAGPGWAIGHLRTARLVATAVVLVGGSGVFWLGPRWVGLGVGYVAVVVVFLAAMLQRNLLRVEASGGFDEIDPERRRMIVERARRRFLAVGGVLVAAGGALAASSGGVIAWIVFAVGAALVAASFMLRRV